MQQLMITRWHYNIDAVMIARWRYFLNAEMITRWQYCLGVEMVTAGLGHWMGSLDSECV